MKDITYNTYIGDEKVTADGTRVRKIVCTTRYCGKMFRAVATCNCSEDKFNQKFGTRLAYLRLKNKVAEYDYARAVRFNNEAEEMLDRVIRKAKKRIEKTETRLDESATFAADAYAELMDFEDACRG